MGTHTPPRFPFVSPFGIALHAAAGSPTRPDVPLPVVGRRPVEHLRRRLEIPPRRVLIGLRAGDHLRRHARRRSGSLGSRVWPAPPSGRSCARLVILLALLALARQQPVRAALCIDGRGNSGQTLRFIERASRLSVICEVRLRGTRRSPGRGRVRVVVRTGSPLRLHGEYDVTHLYIRNRRVIQTAVHSCISTLVLAAFASTAFTQSERSDTPLSTSEIARRVTPTVVTIATPTGHGSGVICRSKRCRRYKPPRHLRRNPSRADLAQRRHL